MPNRHYRLGRGFEYSTIATLKRAGFPFAERFAGSKTHAKSDRMSADVIFADTERAFLCECQKRQYCQPHKMLESAEGACTGTLFLPAAAYKAGRWNRVIAKIDDRIEQVAGPSLEKYPLEVTI